MDELHNFEYEFSVCAIYYREGIHGKTLFHIRCEHYFQSPANACAGGVR